MIEICLKDDNMHRFVMINALICINIYVITCENSMLSHLRLQTHAIRTMQRPRDLPTMYDGHLLRLSWRQFRSLHGRFLRLWKRLRDLSCSPDEDTGGMRQETTGTWLGEIPLHGTRGSSARAHRLGQGLRSG